MIHRLSHGLDKMLAALRADGLSGIKQVYNNVIYEKKCRIWE